MRTSTATWTYEGGGSPRLRRAWGSIPRLLPRLAVYAFHPFRLSAARSMAEFVCAVAAPRFQAEFEEFAATPRGRARVLARSDLAALLDDHDALRALPDGTLGREYVRFVEGAFMNDAGTDGSMSGAGSFLDLLAIDEVAAELAWPVEIVWYLRRMVLTHDLTHVFTGYGTDNAGEFANIAYTIGHFRLAPLLPVVLASMLAVRPEAGRRAWSRYLWTAFLRGRHQRERLSQLDYEALLALPMDEVLERIGIEDFETAHPDGAIVDELGFTNLNLQAMMAS